MQYARAGAQSQHDVTVRAALAHLFGPDDHPHGRANKINEEDFPEYLLLRQRGFRLAQMF